MIRVSDRTIDRAFHRFEDHSRSERWLRDFPETLKLYPLRRQAFKGTAGSPEFQRVYEALKGKWQALRGNTKRKPWGPKKIHAALSDLDHRLQNRRLSKLGPKGWAGAWNAVKRVRGIKQTQEGPSLVAVSKFLHFFNPRLFVVCDRAVVEDWAFGHEWLANELECPWVEKRLAGLNLADEPRLAKYLRMLVVAQDLIRRHPQICSTFVEVATRAAGDSQVPPDIKTYEATAVEWFLLGLVELPPAGVVFPRRRPPTDG